MNIKRLIQVSALVMLSLITSAHALTFKKGANVSAAVTEDDLMQALRQGKDNLNGAKIVIKAGANVPQAMKQKWMANQLSGASAPSEGAESPDVIFVESF